MLDIILKVATIIWIVIQIACKLVEIIKKDDSDHK